MNICIKQRLHHLFIKFLNKMKSSKSPSTHDILIIPCDFEFVGGSRGDEAMIMATIRFYREKYHNSIIYIATYNSIGFNYVQNLNLDNVLPYRLNGCAYNVYKTYNKVVELSPKEIAILGADCMDGFYSDYTSIYLIYLHDILSDMSNCKSHLLGFSFNENADSKVINSFHNCSRSTQFCIRDEVSRKRFINRTSKTAKLTSDTAFLLASSNTFLGYELLESWKYRNNDIKKLIGFNFHPMLRKYKDEEDLKNDAVKVARNLVEILNRYRDIGFVLISHDNRNVISDTVMLDYIYEYLEISGYTNRVYFDRNVYHAHEIKAMVGLLDGMVTSRMHLAIACLGMTIPVMAVTYQGKFEGLFLHFNLAKELLLSPENFISESFIERFEVFYGDLQRLKNLINLKLPDVISLAERNFE